MCICVYVYYILCNTEYIPAKGFCTCYLARPSSVDIGSPHTLEDTCISPLVRKGVAYCLFSASDLTFEPRSLASRMSKVIAREEWKFR